MTQAEQISQAIATVERQISEAKSDTAKKVLAKKLERLKEELKKTKPSLSTLPKARKKVKVLNKSAFQELVEELSKKPEYDFLKDYSQERFLRDKARTAKPKGYRFKGDNDNKPTADQVKKGLKDGTVYYEGRPIRSDISREIRLEKGGNIASFNWNNFTLKELNEALPADVEIYSYETPEKEYNRPYSDENKKFYTTKRLTISQHGEAEVSKGSENIYLDIKCYNAEDKNDMSEYEVSIYTKENHSGLKEVAKSLIEKMKLGGSVKTDLKALWDKTVELAKKGYDKTKEVSKKKIHDGKKAIAIDVINETKGKVGKTDKSELNKAKSIIVKKFADGGTVKFRKLAKSNNFDIVVSEGRYEVELDANNKVKSIVHPSGTRHKASECPIYKKYKKEINEYLTERFSTGGGVGSTDVQIQGFKRNIMGTLSFDLKLSNMRKFQDFIVYPISKGDDNIMIQSSTRIGRIYMETGIGKMSQSHSNGAYGVHLAMDKLIPFQLSSEQLEELKVKLRATAGDKVGSRGIVSDNSGADQFAEGGEISYDKLTISLKSKLVQAYGINRAISYLEQNEPVSPFDLVRKAIVRGYMSIEDVGARIFATAEEVVSEYADMEEIGSSDYTFILKSFLEGCGIKTGFKDNKLVVIGKYSDGGETTDYVDILNEYETSIKKYATNGIKYWKGQKDNDMVSLYEKDLQNHLGVIDNMRKGFWRTAYLDWSNMDTASRENITNSAFDLLLEKNDLPTYAKGGSVGKKKLSENESNKIADNFGFNLDEFDKNQVIFSTRKNGDISSGTFGNKDLANAQKLSKYIIENFDVEKTKIESVDEFVLVIVQQKEKFSPSDLQEPFRMFALYTMTSIIENLIKKTAPKNILFNKISQPYVSAINPSHYWASDGTTFQTYSVSWDSYDGFDWQKEQNKITNLEKPFNEYIDKLKIDLLKAIKKQLPIGFERVDIDIKYELKKQKNEFISGVNMKIYTKFYAFGYEEEGTDFDEVDKDYRAKIMRTYLYSRGGHIDLFEDYPNIPPRVQGILDEYSEDFEDGNYEGMGKALEEVEAEGYTFDFYVDGSAYGLRPKGVKLSELQGYEDTEENSSAFKEGGNIDSSYLGTTRIGKGHYGWTAKTTTKKQINGYDWEITTMKRSSGELVSSANGGKAEQKEGYSTFMYSPFEDPSLRLISTRPKMVNEKAVTKQHEEALKIFIEKLNEMKSDKMATGGKVGEKVYNVMHNVGKAKYVVNFYDGVKTHSDGSRFFDIQIFKNLKGLKEFTKKLDSEGYKKQMKYGGSLNSEDTNIMIYAQTLSYKTGLQASAIKEFTHENNLSDAELLNIVQGIGTKKLSVSDLVTAVSGKKANKSAKEVIAFAKSDEAFKKMATGGKLESEYIVFLQDPDSGEIEKVNVMATSKEDAENVAVEQSGYEGWEIAGVNKMAMGGGVKASEFETKGNTIYINGTKADVKKMYLDYVSNFLTIGAFADHYGISDEQASIIIKNGREYAKKDGHYAKGGSIPDNYEGRTPEDIWNSLSKRQRQHFLYDHLSEIEAYKNIGELPSSEIIKAYNSEWSTLDKDIKNRFTNHKREGQYAKGGSIKASDKKFKEVEDLGIEQYYTRYFGTFATEKGEIELVVVAKITDLEEYVSEDELPAEGNFQLSFDIVPKEEYISEDLLEQANDENSSVSGDSVINIVNYMGGLRYEPSEKVHFKTHEKALKHLMSIPLNKEINRNGEYPDNVIYSYYNRAGKTNEMLLDYLIGVSDKFFKNGGNVGKAKKNKYLYIPNQDISKIVLKSKQVIGKDRILDGAYVKNSKKAVKFTEKYKFPIGSVVWDKTHKRYGVVLNNYGDEVYGSHDEIRLDSDGNQNIHTYDKKWNNNGYNLVPYGSEEDKGGGDLTDNKESAIRIIELYSKRKQDAEQKKYYEDAYKDLLSGKIDGKPFKNKSEINYNKFLSGATDKYRREGYSLIEAIDTAFRDLGLETGGEFDKKELDEVIASNENIKKAWKDYKKDSSIEIVNGKYRNPYQYNVYATGGSVSSYYNDMSEEEILKDTVVYDNGGKTLDRYTVFTPDGSVYGMSESPTRASNGFNQYVGEESEIEKGKHLGRLLKKVPTGIKSAVLDRMKEEFGDGGSMYATGGSMESKKVYVYTGYNATATKDDYEEGELETVGDWDINEGKTFTSKKELIDYINENIIYSDYEETDFDWESGEGRNVQTDVLCSYDDFNGYYPASESEKALWKKGKKTLYNVHYWIDVMPVIPTEFKRGGNTNYSYIENDKIDRIITNSGKEYGSNVILDGAYVTDKVRTPKMSRTQFEDETYSFGEGGNINFNKHIWEGWTVGNFIQDLEPMFNQIMSGGSWQKPFTTKQQVKEWCMDNQPYYKKHVPEVVNYFWAKVEGKYAKGGGVDNFPPKGELKNKNNFLLKYEKRGMDYEFYIYKPEKKDVSSYEQIKYVCVNKDCPTRMSYNQFINYLYAESYLDDRQYAGGGRITKYVAVYVVQGNYGQGWEDLTAHDNRKDARAEMRVYDDNESYPHRVIQRRVLRTDYEKGNYAKGGGVGDVYSKFDLNEKGNFSAVIDNKNYEIIYRDDESQLYDLFENNKKIKSSKVIRDLMQFPKYAKGGGVGDFNVGQSVIIRSDNDNENYDKYRGKELVITHKATSEKEHRGYDSSMEGQGLYDFFVRETGESVPFSLYDYEIEQYAKGGGVYLGFNFNIVYEKPNSDIAYTHTINANSMNEAEKKFYAKHPTCKILSIREEYAKGGGVDEIRTLWIIKGNDAEMVKKGTAQSIKRYFNSEQKKNWRGEKSILDDGAGVESWYEDTTKEEVLRHYRNKTATSQEYAKGGGVHKTKNWFSVKYKMPDGTTHWTTTYSAMGEKFAKSEVLNDFGASAILEIREATKNEIDSECSKGGVVGDYFYDTRKDKNFQVIMEDGDKMAIQYMDRSKSPLGKAETISKNEFEYYVQMGAWNKWKQEYATGGEITPEERQAGLKNYPKLNF